jgi:anti-sigma factor RsiW
MSASPAEMSCQELVELVSGYLEGRLDPADAERFDAHLAACSGCRAYLSQFRATVTALGALPPESLSPDMERRLLAAFRGWRQGRP